MGWEEFYVPSFTERMDDAKDAAIHGRESVAYLGARVTYRRKALRVPWTVEECATYLDLDPSRIKALCGQGRFVGARRSRKGRGLPWTIPAYLCTGTGTYKPVLIPRGKGPALQIKPGLVLDRRPDDEIPI